MNESTKTKKALRGSLFALFLCIVLLIGTTFAWFTDTVSTGVNKIQAGNLDVGLEYQSGTDNDGKPVWSDAEGQTLTFKTADGRGADEILWEPGCTYELPAIRVVNNGNLALKFHITVNGVQGDAKLLEALEWTMSSYDGMLKFPDLESEVTKLMPDKSWECKLSAHMKEEAGNEYQGLSLGGVSITVVATQDTVESDSFNDQYDVNATYPTIVKDTEALTDTIKNTPSEASVNVEVPAGKTVELESGVANSKNNNITITGKSKENSTVDVVTKAVNAEGGQLNYQRGSTFTFENLKVKAGEGSFDGIVCDKMVYKNCTITGKLTLYGKATFINCKFENTMANQYSIWTWGGTDVNFDNCTFNTNGKAILLYGQATAAKPTNLTVKNCTFNDRKDGAAGKAAIEVGNDYNATYNLKINNATVNGFANGKNTGSKVWANKNSMDAAHLSVTIDGKKVQ